MHWIKKIVQRQDAKVASLEKVTQENLKENCVEFRHSPVTDPRFLGTSDSGSCVDGTLKVLFVCTGNICRSAAAAVSARFLLEEYEKSWIIESAGTGAVVGNGIDPDIATALLEFGIGGLDVHVAKQASFEILNAADLIVVFDESHFSWVVAEVPELVSKLIPFRKLAELVSGGQVDIETLKHRNMTTATKSEHWLQDPYRRGQDVARATVKIIIEDIRVILSNLG